MNDEHILCRTHPLLPARAPWLALRVGEGHTQGPQETKRTTQTTRVANALPMAWAVEGGGGQECV